MNSLLTKAQRSGLQDDWLDARMRDNPRWLPQPYSYRKVQTSERKVFVAWRLAADDSPEILDVCRVEAIEASFTAGVTLTLVASRSGALTRVGASPREIVPGVFIWVPAFAEIRFTPFHFANADSVWRLTLPMASRTDGGMVPRPGQVCFWTSQEFKERWPNISI